MALLLALIWLTATAMAVPPLISQDRQLLSRVPDASSSAILAGKGPFQAPQQPRIEIQDLRRTSQTAPLRLEQLSVEDLFKVLLVYQTVAPQNLEQAGSRSLFRPSERMTKYMLRTLLEYNPFTTADYLVHFEASRPAVRLPRDTHDLQEAIQSLISTRYFQALEANHMMSHFKGDEQLPSRPSASWLDQIKPETRRVTTSQVVKEGLTAAIRAQNWAQEHMYPGQLKDHQLTEAVDRAWNLWYRGVQEASGDASIPIQQIFSKLHRR